MFCEKCGHKMPDGSVFCEKCGNKVSIGPNICTKCGHEMPKGSAFCEKCGTQVVSGNTNQQTTVPSQSYPQYQQSQSLAAPQNPQQYSQPQYQQMPAVQVKKSKKGKILFIAIGVVIALFIIGSLADSVDYIGSVKAMKPVTGSSATYEDLANYYFESPKWKERKGDNGVGYVDMSGTPKDSNQEVTITIRVDPTDDPEVFWFTPYRLMIDGQGSGEEAASALLNKIYLDYEYGAGTSDLVDLFDLIQAFS